ncbi:MAG: hypothetical protein HYY21_08710 [Candidatus Tectomicrobia bacterium]|nr:hypothetical protein [Candidatus Tectomicrobia bacterium]
MELLLNIEPLVAQRLIAKAVAALPEVQEAFESGTVVVNAGTTSVLVFYELAGRLPEEAMAAGMVVRKGLCSDARMRAFLLKHGYGASWVFRKGERLREYKLQAVVREFSERDVFIKGANAVDPTGLAGGFLASETYGTIQLAMPVILAKGAHLIVPVSLQKAILGLVMKNCPKMGIRRIDWSIGLPIGYTPIVGRTVTEVEALRLLFGLEAVPVGSGDLLGKDGSETFYVEGNAVQIDRALEMMDLCRNEIEERPVLSSSPPCGQCRHSTCVEKNFNFEHYAATGR